MNKIVKNINYAMPLQYLLPIISLILLMILFFINSFFVNYSNIFLRLWFWSVFLLFSVFSISTLALNNSIIKTYKNRKTHRLLNLILTHLFIILIIFFFLPIFLLPSSRISNSIWSCIEIIILLLVLILFLFLWLKDELILKKSIYRNNLKKQSIILATFIIIFLILYFVDVRIIFNEIYVKYKDLFILSLCILLFYAWENAVKSKIYLKKYKIFKLESLENKESKSKEFYLKHSIHWLKCVGNEIIISLFLTASLGNKKILSLYDLDLKKLGNAKLFDENSAYLLTAIIIMIFLVLAIEFLKFIYINYFYEKV